jgi:hypothetical protein
MQPILLHAPAVMALIALLGLATALYGWITGYVQTDVKSALLSGTLTQTGLMFVAIGLGWFELATWHAGLHALWRAWQFLAAPSYMHLQDAPAPSAPAWLRRWPRLYNAALNGFWLEALSDRLLTRPTLSMARDMRAIDENVVSRLAGMSEGQRAAALLGEEEVVKGRGVAGTLLEWLGAHLQRFEQHLVLQGGGGKLGAGISRLGSWLQLIESLLEQPRYLILMVMATMAVIL